MITKNDVIAVVLGGPSSEAEISRVTGGAIATALREKDYNAKEVELVPDRLLATLHAMNAKVVFNAVHGSMARMVACKAFWRLQAFPTPAVAYWLAL